MLGRKHCKNGTLNVTKHDSSILLVAGRFRLFRLSAWGDGDANLDGEGGGSERVAAAFLRLALDSDPSPFPTAAKPREVPATDSRFHHFNVRSVKKKVKIEEKSENYTG